MSTAPLYGLDAIVLAGGLGTRLQSVWNGPKCIVPIKGRPVVDYVIEDLRRAGVERVILSLGHRAREVQVCVERCRGIVIDRVHFYESEPAGVIAALRAVVRAWSSSTVKLSSTIVVANGDTIVRTDEWAEMLRAHREWKKPTRGARRPYSTAIFDDDTGQHSGLYFIETEALAFNRSIPSDLLEASRPVSGRVHFVDVGTPEGLARAEDFIEAHRL